MKKEVTTNTTEIQKIVRDYYKEPYANKMDSWVEADKLLEMCNLPRLNQEEIENINRSFTSNEIESVNYKLPRNKSWGPDSFTGEFYKTFREELTSILLKLFKKIAKEGRVLNSFYETKTR